MNGCENPSVDAFINTIDKVGYSSPAESGMREDLGLSVSAYSVFSSLGSVGAIAGAIFGGRIADLIARTTTISIIVRSWLACSSILKGYLMGVSRDAFDWDWNRVSDIPVYLAENTPSNLWGRFSIASQLLVVCGVSLMFLVGTVVNWRVLALIGAIPCIVQLFGLFFIPESPRWLAKCGREKELEEALQRLRGKNADISAEAAEIISYTTAFQHLSESRIIDVFQWRYAHSLIVGTGLMLLAQFGGCNAIIAFVGSIFASADFSSNVGGIGLAIVQIPATATGLLLTDKCGRRTLLLVSAARMCSSCILLGLSFLLQSYNQGKELTPILVFIGLLLYDSSYSIGLAGIPWLIMSEIFPVNIRGPAGSLVVVVNFAMCVVVVYSFNFMTEWSSVGMFLIYSSVNGLTILFVGKVVLETKDRTIEQIQASIIHLRQ